MESHMPEHRWLPVDHNKAYANRTKVGMPLIGRFNRVRRGNMSLGDV